MSTGSEDETYRDYKLSVVQSGEDWFVTIWPTTVGQAVLDPCQPPAEATDKEQALTAARQQVDGLLLAAADD